jgi:hypothetical protein
MNPPVLENVNIHIVQIISIIGSFSFLLFILSQIRSKRIKEEYSLMWLFFGFIFIIISLWRESLDMFARLVGVAYPPAALFLILIMAVFVILIQFSIIISKSKENNKHLTQEHSILKLEVERLQKEIVELSKKIDSSKK